MAYGIWQVCILMRILATETSLPCTGKKEAVLTAAAHPARNGAAHFQDSFFVFHCMQDEPMPVLMRRLRIISLAPACRIAACTLVGTSICKSFGCSKCLEFGQIRFCHPAQVFRLLAHISLPFCHTQCAADHAGIPQMAAAARFRQADGIGQCLQLLPCSCKSLCKGMGHRLVHHAAGCHIPFPCYPECAFTGFTVHMPVFCPHTFFRICSWFKNPLPNLGCHLFHPFRV